MSDSRPLRVLDFGRVSPLHSQTLWHSVAYGVSAGAPATLSFLRPSAAYVCLGYHRRSDEVDWPQCRRRGLPVYRRMIGGGPVLLDDGQLFFQITLPAGSVSPDRRRALRQLLAPAAEAFRSVGVDAHLDEAGELVAGDRKVCGHGAGQIGDAVVVVGNLIERFDHEAASAVLSAPNDAARAEVLRLMRRFVAATPADPVAFEHDAISAYAEALGLDPRPGSLTPLERARLAQLDRRFCDPGWLRGPVRPSPEAWQVKVRAGVWVMAAGHDRTEVMATIVHDRIERASIRDAELNGNTAAAERALSGSALGDAAAALARFGAAGARVAAALSKGKWS